MKESDIQKQVIEYLTIQASSNNFFFFSIPNEAFMQAANIGKMDAKTKAMMTNHLKKMGMIAGVPDLCIIWGEKYLSYADHGTASIPFTLFIELKTQTGQVSKVQQIIHKKINEVGHTVKLARSLDDVIGILKTYGVVK